MSKIELYRLSNDLKRFLSLFVIILTIGVSIGLLYVRNTTNLNKNGVVERYNGSEVDDEFDIPDKYPKLYSEMLLTTHNHVITFSIIFFLIGAIFYFSNTFNPKVKLFFMIEPLIAILTTFGSIWGMRYISPSFVYLILISATLMYGSFYIMATITLYELNIKK